MGAPTCDHAAAILWQCLLDGQRRKLDAAFTRYDIDGDGRLSLDEFEAMLPEVHDLTAFPMSKAQQAKIYNDLLVLGDGHIRQADLQQLLYVATTKDHAQRIEPLNLQVRLAMAPLLCRWAT